MSNDVKRRVDSRTSDYICVACGLDFLTEKQKQEDRAITMHSGPCGLCGERKGIAHIRNYNYLRVPSALPI